MASKKQNKPGPWDDISRGAKKAKRTFKNATPFDEVAGAASKVVKTAARGLKRIQSSSDSSEFYGWKKKSVARKQGHGGLGSPGTTPPARKKGHSGRTGEPMKPFKWTDTKSPDFPGWKKMPSVPYKGPVSPQAPKKKAVPKKSGPKPAGRSISGVSGSKAMKPRSKKIGGK